MVVEARLAEPLDVVGPHHRRSLGQLLGELQQCDGRLIESCGAPVLGEAVHHLLVFDLSPEVV